MKRMLKRTAALWLSVLLICGALPFTAAAENYTGQLSDYISYTYNDIRHDLHIYGNGPMEDYDMSPFWGRRSEITRVIISGGVTHIGDNAFNGLSKLGSVEMESGVQSIGKNAFSGTAVSSITLPDSVRSIGDGALTCCTSAVHIPRFTQDIGEDILYRYSTTVYICSTTKDCYAKEYADAHGYTFKVCTHSEHTHNYLLTESVEPTDTEIGTDTYTCSVCGESYVTEFPIIGHTTVHQTEDATCTQDGREYDLCTVCGRELNVVKTTPARGHQFDAQVTLEPTYTHMGTRTYTCTVCGCTYTEDIPEKEISVDSGYSAGDVIEFGSYPQEQVTDEALISELKAVEKEWHSYEYYSGNNSFRTMKPSDYMQYADFEYEGVRYRAVVGSRPKSSLHKCTVVSESERDKYTYFYIYAPLEWVVVDPDSGWLICNQIVDAQPFCNEVYSSAASLNATDTNATYANGVGENASDYKTSSIRAWLNETFWDLAFTGSEQNYIVDTSFPNTGSKTGEAETLSDKVFLCSLQDVQGETLPAAAQMGAVNCTPYAVKQGAVNYQYVTQYTDPVYETCSTWWLRTTGGGSDAQANAVQGYTGSAFSQYVWFVRCVRPSIRLTSIDQALHEHSFAPHVSKEPTCTNAGVRTYRCSGCGYSYTEPIEATGHKWEHKTDAPTCTEAGAEYDECTACTAKQNETVIPAAGHKYDAVVTQDATCTEAGVRTYTCSVCSDSYTEPIEATGHKWEHKTDAATCTEAGAEYDLCTACGAKQNETVIPAAGHKYDAAVTQDATCTEAGVRTYTCSVCSDSYTEPIEATGHTWEYKTDAATCTEAGAEYDLCTACGAKQNETVIPAAGHKYDAAVTQDATCTEAGVRTYTCSVCSDSYTEPIEATGHTWEHKTDAATCTEAGLEYDECTACSAKQNETVIPAAGHKYDAVVTQDATCTEAGVRTYTCSVCEDSYTEPIEATGHKWEHKTDAATCTEPGAEYDECTACSAKQNETVIPAAGHKYDAAVTQDATCTENGVRTYTCSVCEDSYTETIEATGHTWEHRTDAPTCTEPGAEYDECTACSAKQNETVIPAAGHKYDAAVTQDATCTENGVRTYTCSVCEDSYTEPIEASGHKWEHKTDAATCVKVGAEYDLCTVCGAKQNETEIPVAGHTTEHKTKAATCTENGAEYDQCTVCGARFNETLTPAAGHRYVRGVCTVCGATHFWDYVVRDGAAQITAYNGRESYLQIPSTIDGYLVTSIGPAAFAENEDLEYVCVPDSVTYIGAYAFSDCPALQEVDVGTHVARIDAGAFAHCPSLAIVCFFGANITLTGGMFSDADARLMIVAPADSQTEKSAENGGLHTVGFDYPKEKDGKRALAFSGQTTLYADLPYGYWKEFASRFPDVYYMYFDALTFDGISPSELHESFDENFVDMHAKDLTMRSVYVSVQVEGEDVTFYSLMDLLEQGKLHLAITFDNGAGQKLTIFQKIGAAFKRVFNALTKLLRSIVRIFKR